MLRDALGKFRYERAEIRTGLDYSDEPAVYVYAVLGEGAPPLEPKALMNANLALSDALLAVGEDNSPISKPDGWTMMIDPRTMLLRRSGGIRDR